MKLTECSVGSRKIVTRIQAEGPLKQRLLSMGIIKGATVSILAYSPTKSTVEIRIGTMRLALRREEAQSIEVAA